MWLQNEETGGTMPDHVDRRSFTNDFLAAEKEPPPRDPASALRSLIPRSGFKVELVACEPMVMDPIDLAWGPDGKLWVVEMADYPMGLDDRGKPGGRVRFLEDTNGDGNYDKSTVFLEPIPFPTSVMPWRKGVLISAAPTVFYAEDTDGDGRADVRETLFDGFHEGNQQHRVNHLRWGLDNWIYAANGDSDGLIRSLKTDQAVDISGRDFRFRPDDGALDTASGRTQFGRNRDDWGNWFGCNNNNPGWSYALVDHYARRNPHVAAPSGRVDLTHLRDVYPAGRVMTHCFYDQPTPPEGIPGRWTSVAGAMVYRDDLYGPQFAGNFFVTDSVYSVIHRMVLTQDGIRIHGQRPADEDQLEFLASADPWFRPTTLRVGPDGVLWVTDMYRYVVEHPQWIDDRLEKTLELRRGHDRGHIYRIVPVGIKRRPIPHLDRLDTAQLVQALDSPNGWQRDMVQQMLLWRGGRAAIRPLEALVQDHARPQTRLQALCTLDGLHALRKEIVVRALADSHPGVRRHAVRLSEQFVNTEPEVARAVLERARDSDLSVQLQLAYSLGEWKSPEAAETLATLAMRSVEEPFLMTAIMSSAVPHAEVMRDRIRASGKYPELVSKLEKLVRDIKEHPDVDNEVTTAERSRIMLTGNGPITMPTSRERQAALDKYSAVVNMTGDPVRGKKLFVDATCSICHQLDGVGQNIGPDIRTLVDRSPQNLLLAILDPNRAVKERFVEYVAVTVDGRIYRGMLLEQTSNSLTLANGKGEKTTILRRDLEECIPTNRSFMGEGLESSLSLRDLADLLAFLRNAGAPRKRFTGNTPITILTRQDGTLDLPVARAEIYGPEIAFDAKQGCVTNWTSAEAYLAWAVHLHSARKCDVWIEAACPPETSGGAFLIEAAAQTVAGTIPATDSAEDFQWTKVGTMRLAAGSHRFGFRSDGAIDGPLVRLRNIRCTPPGQPPVQVAKAAEAVDAESAIHAEKDGTIHLVASRGKGIGPRIKYQPEFQSFGWFTAADRAEWAFQVDRPGYYEAWMEWSVDDANAGKAWNLSIGGQRLVGVAGRTGSWETYRKIRIGRVELPQGYQTAVFGPGAGFDGALLDLREIQFVPVERKE
ncbi:MAG: PVC-type heme-binding CxxCH protein [Pirellulales bacterium]